jgi:glucose-specific phosphotransferase system IIA component
MGLFDIFKKENQKIIIKAPIDGVVKSIEEVNDSIFSKKLMGDGFMIQPYNGELYAPCDAKVAMVFPTKHAIGLTLKDGTEILIHFGLETVNLNGAGFETFVEQGEKVNENTLLLKADLNYIKEHAEDDCVVFVFTQISEDKKIDITTGGVKHGDEIITFTQGE